jgi:putative oxidoreductase
MFQVLQGPLTVLGRLLLCTIFFMAAVGNKIPHFSEIAKVMESVGVPAPQFMLAGAIVFLLLGSLSVIVGFKARIGAVLLLTFLVLASYYFHPFWKLEGQAQQEQMIHFMKNLHWNRPRFHGSWTITGEPPCERKRPGSMAWNSTQPTAI